MFVIDKEKPYVSPPPTKITVGKVLLAFFLTALIFGVFITMPLALLQQAKDTKLIVERHILKHPER